MWLWQCTEGRGFFRGKSGYVYKFVAGNREGPEKVKRVTCLILFKVCEL